METPPAFALLDLVEILWLPLVIGLVTAAVTWSIWYYTNVPCPAESAALHYCNPARLARYIYVEIWARCRNLGTVFDPGHAGWRAHRRRCELRDV